MSPLSLFNQLQTVFNLITSKNVYLMILALITILIIFFVTTNGSNRKQSKKAYIFLYLAAIIFIAIQYGESILTVLSYAVNEIFINYYFPNIVIYLLMLFTSNIILWKTLFKDNVDRKLKIINSSVFGILLYLFILAIATINSLELDIFSISELYSSNTVRSLLELSMLLFTFWIAVLIIYHFIRKYQYKHNIIKTEEFTNYTIIDNFKIDKAIKVTKQPLYIQPAVEKEPPVQVTTPNFADQFTLEDYKIMAKILKEEKEKATKEPDISNSLTELSRLYQSLED